jgi:hypothetical protein
LQPAQADIKHLAKEINIPLDEVSAFHHALHNENQVTCRKSGNNSIISLEENGLHAFIDEYWLRQGEKETLERRQTESVIATNKMTIINIVITIIFSIIVTTIQVCSYNRETKKEYREVRQLKADSLKQLQLLRHDSLYEKYLLRKAEEMQKDSVTK